MWSFQGGTTKEGVEKFMETRHLCVAAVSVGLQPGVLQWAWAAVSHQG